MSKVSELILSPEWALVFEHPVVRAELKMCYKKVRPSEGSDLAYDLGAQHGQQDTFEFFMKTLPERVARQVKADQERQETSSGSKITSSLPEN